MQNKSLAQRASRRWRAIKRGRSSLARENAEVESASASARYRFIRRPTILALLVLVVLVTSGGYWFTHHWIYTGDAYIYGRIVYVAPEVSGNIVDVRVGDSQAVVLGELLFRIETEPYARKLNEETATLARSRAEEEKLRVEINVGRTNIALAQARLHAAEARFGRFNRLVEDGAVSKDEVDELSLTVATRRAELIKAKAQIRLLEANLLAQRAETLAGEQRVKSAQYYLSKTNVRSPVAGRVSYLRMWPGNYADAGKPSIVLIRDDEEGWIEANFPESDLRHIVPGMRAVVMLDMYPGKRFEGEVVSLARAVSRIPGESKPLPYISPTEEWIRFSRRFPVLIRFPLLPTHPPFTGGNARVFLQRGD